MSQHEAGLIGIYVEKVQVQACKAESGVTVEDEVREIVREAVDHIAIVKSSPPLENLKALAGRLSLIADLTEDHPAYMATLDLASQLVRREIGCFKPRPPVGSAEGEEKISDKFTHRVKMLRLSSGVRK